MISTKMYTYKVAGLALATLSLAACATTGGGQAKEDKAAAERSRAYLQGVKSVAATSNSTLVPCALPAGIEKTMSGVNGPTRDWRDLVNRASACSAKGDWKTLELVANQISRLDIDSPWGAYFLSVSAEGSRDWARALWMVDLAQKKAGKPTALFSYQRGRVLLGMDERVKAITELKKAVDLDSSLFHAHLHLATVLHRDMDTKGAGHHYEEALKLDSKNYTSLVGLAEVRLHEGNPGDAAELYSRAVSANGSQLQPWVRLAYAYEQLKNTELALNTYKGLRRSLDQGAVKVKPDFDLNAKIKTLEDAVKASGQPAQASSVQPGS